MIGVTLAKFTNLSISLNGDDLMINNKFIGSDRQERDQGKASVSIAYSKNNVALGHTGINIRAGSNAPGFAYSTNLNENQSGEFMKAVINLFYTEVNDIFVATSKVIV
jgi:hypothetical protein